MNSLKLISISYFIVISFTLLLSISYLFIKKFKSIFNNDGKLKLSFGIWYGAIFLAGSNVISCLLNVVFEVVDNLIKIGPNKIYLESIKTISLIMGVGFFWFILWFMVVKFLSKLTYLKTNDIEEMEDDNFSYFIIKGAILLGIIFSLSSLLSLIIRALVPTIEVPFYH
jgi:hypothetical protein